MKLEFKVEGTHKALGNGQMQFSLEYSEKEYELMLNHIQVAMDKLPEILKTITQSNQPDEVIRKVVVSCNGDLSEEFKEFLNMANKQ